MQQQAGLSDQERAELERLRTEVATLRAQRQPAGPAIRAGRQRWRTIVAVLLIVLGCVLAPLAGVAVWARNQVTNTERYVAAVAPLANDPAIQAAIADQITTQVFRYIDVQGLTTQAVDALTQRGSLPPRIADQLQALSGPIANGIQSFTRTQVGKIVQSQAFADAWVQANRAAHDELVKALTGHGGGRSRSRTTPSGSTWPPSSRRSNSSWSPPGSPWPSASQPSTPPSSSSSPRTSPERAAPSTCSPPWGTGFQ